MRTRDTRTKRGAIQPMRFWEPPRPTWRRSIWQVRGWLLVIAGLTALGVVNAYDRYASATGAPTSLERADSVVERVVRRIAPDPPRGAAADPEQARFALCDGPVRVTCVVDGDTFWYRGEKIRIADINAPEVSEPGCAAELALGEKATDRLLVLLNQGPFTLAPNDDGTGRDRDKYGRLLRTVTRDGSSVGEELVSEGLAEEWKGYRGNWC